MYVQTAQSWSAFFYSQFWNENGQNVKCARSFIPHSYSGMDGTPFHPFCFQEQNEQNVANAFCTNHSHSKIVKKETRSWIQKPTLFATFFYRSHPFEPRIDKVLTWLELPEKDRPSLVTLYLHEPDYTAHRSGPNSTKVSKDQHVSRQTDRYRKSIWRGEENIFYFLLLLPTPTIVSEDNTKKFGKH